MMEYVKCKNCGGKIENNPQKCPYCWIQHPVEQKGAHIYVVSVLVGAAILIFVNELILGSDKNNSLPKQNSVETTYSKQRKENGFHCLTGWDGSNEDVVQYLKQRLKDPSSYDHIETSIAPIDDRGGHSLIMSYRAKNSFGAYDIGSVVATLRHVNCKIETITII